MNKLVILTTCSFFLILNTSAQRTIRFTESNATLKEATRFISLEQYNQAFVLLDKYLNPLQPQTQLATDFELNVAQYLQKLSSLHLQKLDAKKNIEYFIDTTKYESIKQFGYYHLAKYFYGKGNFESAIPYYEKSGIHFLTNQEISERNFDLAYSYLVTGKLEKVQPLMNSVKNIPGDYFTPGNYYHGILSYYSKKYEEATTSFKQIENDPKYKNIVPFYLAEIDYLTNDKAKALSNAQEYLNRKDKLYYHNELYQLIGQIYFEDEKYMEAEGNLQTYITHCESPRREDYYRIATAQMQQAKIAEAIINFEIMNKSDDDISQKAYYNLASCYLIQGEKNKAYDNLLSCVKGNENLTMLENAEYTLAKLSFDKGDDEWSEKQLNYFIKKYPSSEYAAECSKLISLLQIKNGRMNEAFERIQNMSEKDELLKIAFQKTNFILALQSLKDNEVDTAEVYMLQSRKFPIDETTNLMSDFWQSEINYRLGKYDDALYFSDSYLSKANEINDAADIKKIHLLKSYVYLTKDEKEKLKAEYLYISDDTLSDPAITMGALKSNMSPDYVPEIEANPNILVYNLPLEKFTFDYTPVPLKPLALDVKNQDLQYKNYISGAVGNYATFNFGAGFDLSKTINFPLYVDIKQTSSKGNLTDQVFSQSHLGFKSNQEVGNYLINGTLAFDRNKQYYYGYDRTKYNFENVDIKQRFTNVGLDVNAIELTENRYNINMTPSIYVGVYVDKFQAIEPSLKMLLPFSKKIKLNTTLGLGLLADFNVVTVTNFKTQSNSVISFQPFIETKIKNATVHVGLNPTFGKQTHLLPDIKINYPLDAKNVFLEVGWQSKLQLNTYKQLSTLNPFMFNTFNVKQSRYTEIYAGLNGNFSKNITFNLRGGIAQFNNLPLFINDTSGDFKQFKIIYDKKATALIIDAGLDYTINRNLLIGTNLHARPILDLTTYSNAWGYQPLELSIYGKMKLLPKIALSTDIFLRGGSKVFEKNQVVNSIFPSSLTPGLDMNLMAIFEINKRWNINFDINNLFATKYQRWNGYENFGTNVQLGIIHKFNKIKFIPNNFFNQ